MNLEKLFFPHNLAIIGATGKKGKLGYNVLRNLLEHEYEGRIFPVNPKYDKVQGIEAFDTVKNIDQNVDAAVSIVPAEITPEVVEDCFEKGIEFVSIQSAGFREKGGEGREIENALEGLVEEHGFHILGPNCTGVINTHNGMCQSIGRVGELKPGKVGLIAQAGVYAAGILWGLRKIMNFSIIATIGNKLDIDETDILKYFENEDSVEIIAMYLEDIERGRKFLSLAKEIVEEKPIIVLKGGRTEKGKETAATHTASIGGSREAYETIFKGAGIIQAEDNNHMFDVARAFSKQPITTNDKIMIITYSGSQGITATDTLNEHSLELAELQRDTRKKVEELIPDVITGSNPADLTFDQSPEQVREIIEIVSEDEEVGGFIVNLQPEILEKYVEEFKKIESVGQPVFTSVTGREFAMDEVKEMENIGYPVFSTPERAAEVISEMWKYRNQEIKDKSPERFDVEKEKVGEIIRKAQSEKKNIVGGIRAFEIFEAYGIPVADYHLVKGPEEASRIFRQIDDLIAMKIESDEIVHKTETGGVELNIQENVESIYNKIIEKVISETGLNEKQLRGICIQPMITEGEEALIGASYNELINGHIARFGLGGNYTEIFEDTSTRVVPLNSEKCKDMIIETDYISKILRGPRGEKPCDEEAIIDSLLRLSQLVEDFPKIKEVEANPLIVREDEVLVIDAKLKLDEK